MEGLKKKYVVWQEVFDDGVKINDKTVCDSLFFGTYTLTSIAILESDLGIITDRKLLGSLERLGASR